MCARWHRGYAYRQLEDFDYPPAICQPSTIPYMSEIQSIIRKLEDMVDFFIYLVF